MFKKLKEKITEEVKISPQRFAEFTQSVSEKLQNSTGTDDNFFSIGEDGKKVAFLINEITNKTTFRCKFFDEYKQPWILNRATGFTKSRQHTQTKFKYLYCQ